MAQPPTLTPIQFFPGDQAIAGAATDQIAPVVARGGNMYLSVWQDSRGGNSGQDIWAARLDASGKVIDQIPFPISQAGALQTAPHVVWNGQNWLVVWTSQVAAGSFWVAQVQAARVTPEGVALDQPPLLVTDLSQDVMFFTTVSTDGSNWLVVTESADVRGVRISPQGVILDPGGVQLLPTRVTNVYANLELAFASNRYLLLWDEFGAGSQDVMGVRLSPSLQVLDASPLVITATQSTEEHARAASNGTDFFVVWRVQDFNRNGSIWGSRVLADGKVTDPGGKFIASTGDVGSPLPTVSWDGAQWITGWDEEMATPAHVRAARVSASGTIIDPGGVIVAVRSNSEQGPAEMTGALEGGALLVWQNKASLDSDVFRAYFQANGSPGPAALISKGAPAQVQPRFATDGARYMTAYVSQTSAQTRIVTQLLDAAGGHLGSPVFLANGPNLFHPAIAWNGTLYLVVWNDIAANQIFGRRVSVTGAPVDAAPIALMAGSEADVAANGANFLVTGTNSPGNPEIRNVFGVRVDGATGSVVGAPAIVGSSFAVGPRVANFGTRWIVVWEAHPTHDDPHSSVNGNYVDAAGIVQGEFVAVPLAASYHYNPAVAATSLVALVVWEDPRVSNADWNIYGMRIAPNGTLLDGPGFSLTAASNNQGRAAVAWDGREFVAAWEDLRANPFFLDLRTDIFATRVSAAGQVLDPNGIAIANTPLPEASPAVTGAHGVALVGGAIFRDSPPYASFRTGYRLLNFTGDQFPVAVASAAPLSGTAPLPVNFSSAGSFDSGGALSAFQWTFGDGATSASANPDHTYQAPGTFFVNLAVTDAAGHVTTNALMITPLAPPAGSPPVAIASATPTKGAAPVSVSFNSTGSTGSIDSFQWDFGDGSVSVQPNPVHTFTNPGFYGVLLTVTDSQGLSGSDVVTVEATGTLRTTAISINVRADGGGGFTSKGTVTVKDAHGVPVPGALVTATWTVPGPFMVQQISQTDATGIAAFSSNSSARGSWTLTVNDVLKGGYSFDKLHSVLTKTVDN